MPAQQPENTCMSAVEGRHTLSLVTLTFPYHSEPSPACNTCLQRTAGSMHARSSLTNSHITLRQQTMVAVLGIDLLANSQHTTPVTVMWHVLGAWHGEQHPCVWHQAGWASPVNKDQRLPASHPIHGASNCTACTTRATPVTLQGLPGRTKPHHNQETPASHNDAVA